MTIIEALVQLRDDLKTWVANNLRMKLDKNLGTDNAGKVLAVDEEGNVVPVENSLDDIKETFVINVDGYTSSTSDDFYPTYSYTGMCDKTYREIYEQIQNGNTNNMILKWQYDSDDAYCFYFIKAKITTDNIQVIFSSTNKEYCRFGVTSIPLESSLDDNAEFIFTSQIEQLFASTLYAGVFTAKQFVVGAVGDSEGTLSMLYRQASENSYELRPTNVVDTETCGTYPQIAAGNPIEDYHVATKGYADGFVITVGVDGVANKTYEEFLEMYNIGCTNFVVEQVISENTAAGDRETRRYTYGGANIDGFLDFHRFFCIENKILYMCSFNYSPIEGQTDLTAPIEVSFSTMEPSAKKFVVLVEDDVAEYTYREISEIRQALGNGELVIQQKIGTVDYMGIEFPKCREYFQVRELPWVSADGTEYYGWTYDFVCPESDAIRCCTLNIPKDTDATYDNYATVTFTESPISSGEYSCHTVEGVEYGGTYAEMYYNKDEYSMPKLKAGEPVESWHATTKFYVDSALEGKQDTPMQIVANGSVNEVMYDNSEGIFTDVYGLTLDFSDARQSFGTVVFSATEQIQSEINGCDMEIGDNIADAANGETWEFNFYKGNLIWKNWGVLS